MNDVYHTPVLLKDCVDALQIKPGGVYVDATFGGGGHSREMLKQLGDGRLFGFDTDADAAVNRPDDKRFTFISKNFRDLKTALHREQVTQVDGILADLGVSSHQFDSAQRGFSTRFEAEPDMRMNRNAGTPTALDILRSYPEQELKRIFREYGELRNAAQVAKKIIANRSRLNRVNELKAAIAPCAERGKENQFYAKVFQALRIEVNDEMNALKELLKQSRELLRPGGRMAVISYHSLEDRLVKNFFRSGKFEGEAEKDVYGNLMAPFRPVTRKAIVPDEQEIDRNPRARSAKLRMAEKI